jgi:hypothetical protein
MNNLAAGTPLNTLAPDSSSIERMPPTTDLNVLPDMGKMTVRLRLTAASLPASI